jgi:RNA polymerase sigma-70 factor, ECF subfamily
VWLIVSNLSPSREFLDLFTGSQLKLYRYIITLVANQADAEDVLQNVNLVLHRKCEQFELGTNFLAWAMNIAYWEVAKHRAQKKRNSPGLSDATLEALANDVAQQSSLLEHRNAALPDCMSKLSTADRELVRDHYFRGLSWEAIASALGRTASSVRHSICRIRRELKRCIDSNVPTEDHS